MGNESGNATTHSASFAKHETGNNLPANKRSDEGSTGDTQCPNSQCGTTVSGWIHLFHVRRAQRQRGTHTQTLEDPSDQDSSV